MLAMTAWIAGKGVIEQAVQHLYPLELSVNHGPKVILDPTVPSFRPQCAAAVIANGRIQEITQKESSDI